MSVLFQALFGMFRKSMLSHVTSLRQGPTRNQSIKSEWWYIQSSLSLLAQDPIAKAPLDDDSRSNSMPTIDNSQK